MPLPTDADPYTAQNPPQVLTFMALAGAVLPRTAFTYVNLGPTQQVGTELWVEQRISRSASAWFNYSWQDEPQILESDNPYLSTELSLSPTHRVNVGASLDGSRFLGNASVSRATAAFWSDVLTPEYHGYSDGYTMVNGSFGVKWSGGRRHHDADQGDEPVQPEHPAAHLRRHSSAHCHRRGAVQLVACRWPAGGNCWRSTWLKPRVGDSFAPRSDLAGLTWTRTA